MTEEAEESVPGGAALFPLIPPELGVNPLLLAVLHATVFLAGSDTAIINPAAADEAVQYMAGYLGRLSGPALQQVREDMEVLTSYARQQQWSKQLVRALKTFLDDYGIGEESDPS